MVDKEKLDTMDENVTSYLTKHGINYIYSWKKTEFKIYIPN